MPRIQYSNCGQLLPPHQTVYLLPRKPYLSGTALGVRSTRVEKIVFHGLRHSSATYQLLNPAATSKAVQGNTGHATATVLMDTYAHTQDKPRLELTEKIEADFYSQDIGSPKSGSVPVKESARTA